MELAKKLEKIRTYLDPETNILSEPDKMQLQMVEGNSVFDEAIQFLKKLSPLKPLQWDENLAKSAKEHVDDIGPKGLLLYQSSDGTEPEDRITKYGDYIGQWGENIDFGPNDAIGIIVSLTLDDGEEDRPHRENLFSENYQKVGIACGKHETEFQMCVMDFAFDFKPISNENINNVVTNNIGFNKVQNLVKSENFQKNIDKEYTNIKNQLDSEKNNNQILNKKILELEEKNRNLEKLLKEEKIRNNILIKENARLKEEKDKNPNNYNNYYNSNLNIDITKALLEKDKMINELNNKLKRYPFELNEGEKLISLIIYLPNQAQFSMICKNTEKFHKIEERLYEKFEKYKETDNFFLFYGKKVSRFNTLKENFIKDGDIIQMKIYGDEE